MVTAFGKFCRKLRIDREEILKDMADKLGVRSSFLSAVELGKKKIPSTWEAIIVETYGLNFNQIEELKSAISRSVNSVKINLTGYDEDDRDLVLSFARRFDNLTLDDRNMLKSFFNDK